MGLKDLIYPGKNLQDQFFKLNEKQKNKILENTFAIQLTQGCSTGCLDCGLGAKKGVTDYIPFDFIKNLFKNYRESIFVGDPTLYWASEPFDYDFEGKDYLDVLKIFCDTFYTPPITITSIPKGKESLIFGILIEDLDKERDERIIQSISLTKYNYSRVKKKFEEFRDSKELRKYWQFKVISDDYPFEGFLRYLSFMGGRDNHLVKNFYNSLRDPRLKLSELNKDNLEDELISTYQGVVISPKGAYNVIPIKPTFENPVGQKMSFIDPDNFNVNDMKYLTNKQISLNH